VAKITGEQITQNTMHLNDTEAILAFYRLVDSFGDTVINLSSGTRIDLIGYSDSSSVTFEVI